MAVGEREPHSPEPNPSRVRTHLQLLYPASHRIMEHTQHKPPIAARKAPSTMPTATPPPPFPARASAKLWYARQSRLARITVWLLGIFAVGFISGVILGTFRGIAVVLILVSAPPLAICLLLLFSRWFSRRVLWSVRNRLTVTYLLMGLAPIVLFTSLGGIALYLFAGQYSTNTALADLEEASKSVASDSASAVVLNQHLISDTGKPPTRVSVSVLRDGNWQPLVGVTSESLARPDEPVPTWLRHSFRGIIERNGRLYLCAADTANTPHGPTEIFGSRPLDEPTLGSLDQGLGVLRIFSHNEGEAPDDNEATPAAHARRTSSQVALKGGSLPAAGNLIDAPIYFTAPIPIYAWNTGEKISSIIVVASRPTILYHRLFANSFSEGKVQRIILLTVIVAFAVLELFAVLMAMAVSRTIVGSVAALYRGTRAIDAGNLEHRVPVKRHDQLGELARSFNRMAGSIADLLIQQREKDKLLNELSIAQEVQRTLFPQSPATGAGLELHAVCVPALSVGGGLLRLHLWPAKRGLPDARRHQRQGHVRRAPDGVAPLFHSRSQLRQQLDRRSRHLARRAYGDHQPLPLSQLPVFALRHPLRRLLRR